MKIKFKLKYLLFVLLTSLTFICIGFSTWNVLVKEELNIPVTTDKIINSSDYIFLDKTKGDTDLSGQYTGIEMFQYTDSTFINKDGFESSSTYMKVYFKLDVNKCKQIFLNNSPLILKFNIRYDSKIVGIPNIFKDDIVGSATKRSFNHQIKVTESNITYNVKPRIVKDYSYVVPVELPNVLNSNLDFIHFEVQYDLFCQTGPYFKDTMFKVLYGENIENKLILESLITGQVKE